MAQSTPTVTVAPNHGDPGTIVRAEGGQWEPGNTMSLYLDAITPERVLVQGAVDGSGRFVLHFEVPDAAPGDHAVVACARSAVSSACQQQASAAFRVESPAPPTTRPTATTRGRPTTTRALATTTTAPTAASTTTVASGLVGITAPSSTTAKRTTTPTAAERGEEDSDVALALVPYVVVACLVGVAIFAAARRLRRPRG